MIASLKRIVKKDIIKVFSLTAISTFIRMLTGFISIKVVAVLIGPTGIALLGQLNNFSSVFLTLSAGGINSGVTKYVAEDTGSNNKIASILTTSLYITIILSLICGLILIIGSGFFSNLILKDIQYSSIFTVFGFVIIFYSLNSLLLSILNGFKEFKKFVLINITGSLTGLFISVLLVFYFGIYGALLSAVTFQSIVFIVTLLIVLKCTWFKRDYFFGKFSKTICRKLSHYTLMAFVSAATVPVSQLIIRSFLSEQASLSEAGVWEGMNRISGMYLLVITSSLGVYYLPRLSEISNPLELRDEILNTYKIILPPLFVLTLAIYFFRDIIIHFLFNEKFETMRDLFLFQLLGDYFKIASWILAFLMIAKSMTRTYVITEIIFSALSVGLAMYFIRLFGNVGATVGYFITYFLYFITMMFIFRKIFIGPGRRY